MTDALERWGTAPGQTPPARPTAAGAGPALAAAVIAIGIAVGDAKTLLQLPPHAVFGDLPGPTTSDVGILSLCVSLVGAAALVFTGRKNQLPDVPRESLAAWMLAVTSGWGALVALRLFDWTNLATAWGWGIVQLTLAMIVALVPVVRGGWRRGAANGGAVASRAESTGLAMCLAVFAAFAYGRAHGVGRVLPVACAAAAVAGWFLVATLGRRDLRDGRGVAATLLAGGVMAAAICWPTAATRWGIRVPHLWLALHWVVVVWLVAGLFWRAIWFTSCRGCVAPSLWVDCAVLGIASVGAASAAALDVAGLAMLDRSASEFPWWAAGEIVMAVLATIAAAAGLRERR